MWFFIWYLKKSSWSKFWTNLVGFVGWCDEEMFSLIDWLDEIIQKEWKVEKSYTEEKERAN